MKLKCYLKVEEETFSCVSTKYLHINVIVEEDCLFNKNRRVFEEVKTFNMSYDVNGFFAFANKGDEEMKKFLMCYVKEYMKERKGVESEKIAIKKIKGRKFIIEVED